MFTLRQQMGNQKPQIKDRQYNGQTEGDINDLQNTTQKTKD